MSSSLKQKTVSGVWWSGIERFSVQGMQFLIQIVMARLLLPSDYGMIGMLIVFLAVAQTFIDSGFSNALIQKKDRDNTDYSTVFYFNVVVGILAYGLTFLAAPYIALFYQMPDLELVMRVIAVNLFLYSLTVVQRAQLTVKIDFKTQAKASIVAVCISGTVGILMAYHGFGVWALVFQAIVNATIEMLLLWIYARWIPTWIFSLKSFKRLFSFGSKLLLSGLLETVYRHLYTVVIGKKFSAQELGYYTRADQFAQFPSGNLSAIICRVIFPVLSDIQDEDERLEYVYRKYLRVSAYIIFPLMIGLCVLAKPFITLVLTDKWESSVILLQVLCLAYILYPVHTINLNLLQVKGRSDLFLRLEIIKKVVGVIILIVTIPLGVRVMCGGIVVSSFIALFLNTYYTKRIVNVGLVMQLRDLTPIFCLALTMGGGVWGISQLFSSDFLKLLLGCCSGIVYYFFMSRLLYFKEWEELISLIKKS